ncbi:MAG: putative ABC transporter permease [Clostridia bacterium]|nr:putative ABC transporter permease [Clostridia bacterium]
MLECIYFFIIGSFAGWLLECLFRFMAGHLDKSPGILNTPFCILYGFGTVALSLIISRITTNAPILFLLSAAILTLMEYVTYILLRDIYGLKLWDYSNMTFKLDEKVCLEFSLIWGTLGVLYIKYLLPILTRFFYLAKGPTLIFAIYILFGIIFVDFVYSNYKLLRSKKMYTVKING